MDYSKISKLDARIYQAKEKEAECLSSKHNSISDAKQQQITEFSKEASEAITAASKAGIKMYSYNPDESCCFVAKESIDPSLRYIRQSILEKAGVFDDESIKNLTKSFVQAENKENSKFMAANELGIENFAITTDEKGIRGGSLFSAKGRKRIAKLKNYGIKRVIDLRADGDPDKYREICKKSGLEYFKFPIAYDEKWTQENIDKIPEFVETMKKGDFYIGCATGLHRTDTGLALNYFFNPNPTCIPKIEAGTTKNKTIAIMNKIMAAVNDICYLDKGRTQPRLDEEFAKELGWNSLDEMLSAIQKRKVSLSKANNIL